MSPMPRVPRVPRAPSRGVHAVAHHLLCDGYYDNEPDALRAAIHVIAAAETITRAECMARHPSSLPPTRVG